MTRRLLLNLFFLVLPSFIFSQQDEWDVYMAQYEKGLGSTVLNMSLKQTAPKKEFPFVLVTGVTFKDCDAEGLPGKKQFPELYKISDSVNACLERNCQMVFAGTFTYQCERLDYYYIKDSSTIRKELFKMYNAHFKNYTPYINIKADSQWEAYLSFLYPNEEAFETMQNQKVVLNLVKEGDKLEKERKVDHWLYFSTENDRNCFITYATANKYKIENKELLKNSVRPYKLQISKTGKVDLQSITAITIELNRQAKKCHGNYDGWETMVIK